MSDPLTGELYTPSIWKPCRCSVLQSGSLPEGGQHPRRRAQKVAATPNNQPSWDQLLGWCDKPTSAGYIPVAIAAYRQQAIDAFHKAIELSPHRIQPRLLLARVYSGARDFERALVVLSDAVKSDPLLGEPRYRLAEAYIGAGHGDSALAMLQSSLRLGYVGAPELYLAMGKRLEFSGRSGVAATLYSDYLEAKYTEAVWNRSEAIDKPIPTADIAVAAHLPLLYMRARESELAIKTAAALSAFDPSRASIVDRFVSDIGARRRASWVAKNSLLPCTAARASRSRDSVALGACGSVSPESSKA